MQFFGSGIKNIFPKENFWLYKKILENEGLIISEYPPYEEAESDYFRERNRIISGLSLGVLVVEALYRSGTSITAKLAMNQKKEVFTVPHEIWDSRGVGTNRLLKQGAKLVTDTSDILNTLKLGRFHNEYLRLKKDGFFDDFNQIYESTLLSKCSINSEKSIKSSQNISSVDTPVHNITNPKHIEIYNIIKNTNIPLTSNDLAHKTEYSINEILSILFILEINGNIKKSKGGYICI